MLILVWFLFANAVHACKRLGNLWAQLHEGEYVEWAVRWAAHVPFSFVFCVPACCLSIRADLKRLHLSMKVPRIQFHVHFNFIALLAPQRAHFFLFEMPFGPEGLAFARCPNAVAKLLL